MMNNEQYVVTGIGLHNSLGIDVISSWNRLLLGDIGISALSWPKDDPTNYPATHSALTVKLAAIDTVSEYECIPLFTNSWRHWDNNTKSALLSVNQAMVDSNLKSTNVGVVMSTIGGATSVTLELDAALTNGIRRLPPRKTLSSRMDYPASQIAAIYKTTGTNIAIDSACTTGIASIEYAINQMKCNTDLDAMIVAAADHMASPHQLYWFQNIGAIWSAAATIIASKSVLHFI